MLTISDLDKYYDITFNDLDAVYDIDSINGDKIEIFSIFRGKYSEYCLRTQLTSLNKHLKDEFSYTVIDNVKDTSISDDIKDYCISNNVNYIKFSNMEFDVNISYGVICNWIFKNIVKIYKPKYFGFLYEGIFLNKDLSITDRYLIPHYFYGSTYFSDVVSIYWSLRPEINFYNYEELNGFELDFMPSPEIGLYEPGGTNCIFLWRFFDRIPPCVDRIKMYDSMTHHGGTDFYYYAIDDISWIYIHDPDYYFENVFSNTKENISTSFSLISDSGSEEGCL